METLGPETRTDPESERAAQAPRSPSTVDDGLAGTLDGEGKKALLRVGGQLPLLHVLGFPSFLRGREAG